MPSKPTFLYWDACVFLAYIQNEPERAEVVKALLEKARNSNRELRIVTAAISITEVAYVSAERENGQLNPDTEAHIDGLWKNQHIITCIDLHEGIMWRARDLIRLSLQNGWKPLKPADAIHLAAAEWIKAHEVHTYDDRWEQYSNIIGRPIHKPSNAQLILPGMF